MPRIPYASTTQARVSPLVSSANKVWNKVVLSAPYYLDALEGHLDGRECDAPALADVHVWLLLFAYDIVLTLELEVGL
jgi:hypothetical protein